MTVAFRSVAHATGSIGDLGNLTITKPTGTVQDDLLIARIVIQDQSPADIIPPAGWTQVGSDSTAAFYRVAVFKKQAGGSEPASYDFQQDSTGGFSNSMSGVIVAYDGSGLLDVDQFAENGSNGGGADPVAPTITPTRNPSLLVTLGFVGGSTTFTAPAGQTERLDTAHGFPDITSYAGDEPLAVVSATGTRTVDAASPADRWWGANLNIYEVAGGPQMLL